MKDKLRYKLGQVSIPTIVNGDAVLMKLSDITNSEGMDSIMRLISAHDSDLKNKLIGATLRGTERSHKTTTGKL